MNLAILPPKFVTIGAVTRIEIITGNEGGQEGHKAEGISES